MRGQIHGEMEKLMKNKAYVKEITCGKAILVIKRECACSKNESCNVKCFTLQNEIIETIADNSIGVKAGDFVEVEAKNSAILMYSAVVFILPVFAGLTLYFIARIFIKNIVLPYVISAAGFGLSIGFLYFFLNNIAKSRNDFKITKIL
jgi:positive regulator of sigma E activity